MDVYTNTSKCRYDMPLPEELDILMLEDGTAKISASGIKRNNRYYWNDAFIHHDGETVRIRLDPIRPHEIYVYLNGKLVIAETKELCSMSGDDERVGQWIAKQKKSERETKDAIKSYGVTEGQVRAIHLSQYTDDPHLLSAITGKNTQSGSESASIVRLNRTTLDGAAIGRHIAESDKPVDCDYYVQAGQAFLEKAK